MLSSVLISFAVIVLSMTCQQDISGSGDFTNDAAIVSEVKAVGNENQYTFNVTIKSPDTGCEQYADWWEVISADGTILYYRRILAHSHVSEQPFTRSGGPVNISRNTEVIIRAHMNPSGYGIGKIGLKGSVSSGFIVFNLVDGLGADLDKIAPLPDGCAF